MRSINGDLFEQLPVGTLLRVRRPGRDAWVHKYRKMGLSAGRQLLPKELVIMLGCIDELPGYKLMQSERLVELLTYDGIEVLSYWEITNVRKWFEVV